MAVFHEVGCRAEPELQDGPWGKVGSLPSAIITSRVSVFWVLPSTSSCLSKSCEFFEANRRQPNL